jgi:hypothetical protein
MMSDAYRDYLYRELYRDRSWSLLGCAATAGVAAGVLAVHEGATAELAAIMATLAAILGGVLRYNYEQTRLKRIRRELGLLSAGHNTDQPTSAQNAGGS